MLYIFKEYIQEYYIYYTIYNHLFIFIKCLIIILLENFQVIIKESQNKFYYFLTY